MVDIEAVQEMEKVSLVDIKANPALDGMPLFRRVRGSLYNQFQRNSTKKSVEWVESNDTCI